MKSRLSKVFVYDLVSNIINYTKQIHPQVVTLPPTNFTIT